MDDNKYIYVDSEALRIMVDRILERCAYLAHKSRMMKSNAGDAQLDAVSQIERTCYHIDEMLPPRNGVIG